MDTVYDSNPTIEESLIQSGLKPLEKVITRDTTGHMVCHFVKVQDYAGRTAYVELDCDDAMGMGYVKVNNDDSVLIRSESPSRVDYSKLMGAFNSNKEDVYGISFECDDSVCVMTRRDGTLDPFQQNFYRENSDEGSEYEEPMPFPVIKITEVLANPKAVRRSLQQAHDRIHNVTFNKCKEEVDQLTQNTQELKKHAEMFQKMSQRVIQELSDTIFELENMYQNNNSKEIAFNLAKRNELAMDFINLCHSLKKYNIEFRERNKELEGIYNFSEQLFDGLTNIFVE